MNRWVRCESTKRPGTYFYHNAFTQTSIWHLEDMVHVMPNQSVAPPAFDTMANLNRQTCHYDTPQYSSKYKSFTFGKDFEQPRHLSSFSTQNNLNRLSSESNFDIFRSSSRISDRSINKFGAGKLFDNNTFGFGSGKRNFASFCEEPKQAPPKKRKILYDIDVNEQNYKVDEEVQLHLDLSNIKKLAPPGALTDRWMLIVDDNVLTNNLHLIDQLIQTDPTCLMIIPFVVRRQLEWLCQMQNSGQNPAKAVDYLSKCNQVYEQTLIEAKSTESNINSILYCCRDLKDSDYFVILVSNNLALHKKATDASIRCFTITELKQKLQPDWTKISPFPKIEPLSFNDTFDMKEVIQLKNKSEEEKCEKRMDEWIVRYSQILETLLSSLLGKKAPKHPAPWTLYEAVERIKLFYKNSQVQEIANKLSEELINNTVNSGKIDRNIKIKDFMKIFKYTISLTQILLTLENNDLDIKLSIQYLKDLNNDIENPTFDFDTSIFSRKSPLSSTNRLMKDLTLNKECIKKTTQISNKTTSESSNHSTREDIVKQTPNIDNDINFQKNEKNNSIQIVYHNTSSSSTTTNSTSESDSGIHSTQMSCQIENIIRTLYSEVGDVFLYIHKFVGQVVKKFTKINSHGMEIIGDRSTKLHTNLTNIIGVLHRILAKEVAQSEDSVHKLISRYPLIEPLQDDKRFCLFSNMISKLLEQAGILAEALIELITVIKNSGRNINLDLIGPKVNYINVFQG